MTSPPLLGYWMWSETLTPMQVQVNRMDPRNSQGDEADEMPIYVSIVGLAALLCFAFMLTGSFWMTTVVLVLGCLHLARHFPAADEIVQNDIALRWLRRLTPLIIFGIFVFQVMAQQSTW